MCIPNNSFFPCVCVCVVAPRLRQRSSCECEFSVLPTILSNNPNLHLLPLICDWWEPGPYALIMVSLPGQRRGQRTLGIIHCVSGVVGPWWIRRLVDEGTGHTIVLPKHSHLHLKKQPASLLTSPSSFPPSPPAQSPISCTPGCQGVWGRGRASFFFSSLSGKPS